MASLSEEPSIMEQNWETFSCFAPLSLFISIDAPQRILLKPLPIAVPWSRACCYAANH